MNPLFFDIPRLALLVIVIAYAAWKDHKTGEVTNHLWLYLPFGFSLTLAEYAYYPQLISPALLSIAVTTVFSIVLFYIGGWGGADGKAFITIAVSMPLTPFLKFTAFSLYPLNVILVSVTLAVIAAAIKKQKHVRFLPYTLVGMAAAFFI